jgi:hypothetical protein
MKRTIDVAIFALFERDLSLAMVTGIPSLLGDKRVSLEPSNTLTMM